MTQTIIILIVYALYHVISYLAKAAAKRKEQEQMRQAAQQRSIAIGTMTPPVASEPVIIRQELAAHSQTSDSPIVAETRPQVRIGRVVDDSVANRKKQLEQLRNRRDLKKTPTTKPGPSRVGKESPTFSAGPGSARGPKPDQLRRQQQQRLLREREVGATKRAQQPRMAQKREDQFTKSEVDASQSSQSSTLTPNPEIVNAGVAASRIQNPSHHRGLRAKLRDRPSLRELYIVKEILDRPLAMRSMQPDA